MGKKPLTGELRLRAEGDSATSVAPQPNEVTARVMRKKGKGGKWKRLRVLSRPTLELLVSPFPPFPFSLFLHLTSDGCTGGNLSLTRSFSSFIPHPSSPVHAPNLASRPAWARASGIRYMASKCPRPPERASVSLKCRQAPGRQRSATRSVGTG